VTDEGTLGQRARLAWSLVWRASPGVLLGSGALAVVSGVWPVLAAWLTKLVLDELSRPDRDRGTLIALATGLAVTGLLTVTLPNVRSYLDAELRRQIDLACRDRLFGAVNRSLGLGRFESPHFQDRLRVAENAGQGAAGQILLPVVSIVRGATTAIGFVVILVAAYPVMAAIVLASAVPAVGTQVLLSRRRAGLELRLSPLTRRQFFYARLLTTVGAAKEVRLFGLGDFLRNRLLAETRSINRAERALQRKELWLETGLGAVAATVAGGGLVWVVARSAGGGATVGDIAVFVAAVAGVQAGLTEMVTLAGLVYQALLLFGHYRAVVTAGTRLGPAVLTTCCLLGAEVPGLFAGGVDGSPPVFGGGVGSPEPGVPNSMSRSRNRPSSTYSAMTLIDCGSELNTSRAALPFSSRNAQRTSGSRPDGVGAWSESTANRAVAGPVVPENRRYESASSST